MSVAKGNLYNVKRYHYEGGMQIRLYSDINTYGFSKSSMDKQQTTNYKKKTDEEIKQNEKNSVKSSMNRTIQNIHGITRANNWQWFVTLTFDRNLVDSSNYDLVKDKACQWFQNQKKRFAHGMKYIIIPELHKDGKHWHIHGLMSHCGYMSFIDSGIIKSDKHIYNLSGWRFGFSTASSVEDSARVASYITKYITKELCELTKNAKRYWCSKNCLRMVDVMEHDFLSEDEKKLYIRDISDKITYMKTQKVPQSGQVVKYIEVEDE